MESEKELPAARRKRLLRQFSKVARASLGTGLMGTLFTFPSVLASDLQRNPTSLYGTPLSMDGLQDLVGSLLMLSSLPGAWLTAVVAMRLGRRRSMMLCGVVAVLGWLGVALVPYPAGILTARCVSGLALGGLSVVVNAYVAELSDDDVRGMMSMSLNLAILLGQVFTVAVGYGARYYVVAFINALVPVAFVLFLIWLPESPSVLVLKDKNEKAKAVLLDLRGSKADVTGEIKSYKEFNSDQQGQESSAWRKLLQPAVLKNLVVVSALFVLVAFTGFLVVNANAAQMFQAAGTTVDAELAAIVLMLVQFGGGLAGFFLTDKIGRKNILYVGFILMTLGLGGMAVYSGLGLGQKETRSYIQFQPLEGRGGGGGGGEGGMEFLLQPPLPPSPPPYNTTTTTTTNLTLPLLNIEERQEEEEVKIVRLAGGETKKEEEEVDMKTVNITKMKGVEEEGMEVDVLVVGGGGWVPLACLVVSQTGVSLGVNVMPFILNQEYFPTAIRSQASGVCFTVWTLATFAVLQLYTPMVNSLTQAGLYGFYGAVCLLGLPLRLR
ncbi:facilitated trehalose transporter Tret1-like, partial [Eriocheir sinensis]|uniref:facilitated trehalose transporter Tret1-like n=1 Tax=Eriocheir sinensis TaxID=95602 RepID=UPI0021C83AA1